MKYRPNWLTLVAALMCASWLTAASADLAEIRARGELRHLGIPYANFVTGLGDGMSVELAKGFAAHLGVQYQFVRTDWPDIIGDLTGKKARPKGEQAEVVATVPIRGDMIATGMTILPWRQTLVTFTATTFPTQVWLVARHDSPLHPIAPTGTLAGDIALSKGLLADHSLLGKAGTCLDPSLYDIQNSRAKLNLFPGSLNELAPALLSGESELTLLDVPDALVALQKWPGQIKVLGPISEIQGMAPAFRPEDKELIAEFDRYFKDLKASGKFRALVEKYYPFVGDYFPEFIANAR